jgi:hypothetical protein
MLELYPSEEHFKGAVGASSPAVNSAQEDGQLGYGEDVDFDEIDDDLERFQEDEMVKQALHRGVDLRKYGQELGRQLKEVISAKI